MKVTSLQHKWRGAHNETTMSFEEATLHENQDKIPEGGEGLTRF